MFAAWREMRLRVFRKPRIVRGLAVVGFALAHSAGATPGEGGVLEGASPKHLVAQAVAYEHGEGVPKDQLKAAALYCDAARDGDSEAQFNLGWMYANGRGVARDDAAAAAMFRMAAAGGHAYAQRMLGFLGDEPGRLPECMGAPEPPWIDTASDTAEGPDFFAVLPAWKRQIADIVAALAPRYGVDPRLALSVIQVESNFEPRALSVRNAQGLMQLVPETAGRFNVTNPLDVRENLRGGTRLPALASRVLSGKGPACRRRLQRRRSGGRQVHGHTTLSGNARICAARAASCSTASDIRTIPASPVPRRS